MEDQEKMTIAANEISTLLSKYQKEGFSVFNLLSYKNFSTFGSGGSKNDIIKALIHMIKRDKNLCEIWEAVTMILLEEENQEEIEKGEKAVLPLSLLPNTTVN